MRELFVFKDTNYGASKTSATLNTALTPADLADGAIGIYGEDPVLNAGTLSLITDAAASSGALVNKSDFKGKVFYIGQGTSDGCRLSNPYVIDNSGNLITSKVYTVGAKGVTTVGYNGTSGSLNLPSVINRGDEGIVNVNDLTQVQAHSTLGKSYSGYAVADNDDDYTIGGDFVENVYDGDDSLRKVDVDLISNLAGTTDIGGTSSTFTHGSADVVHTGTDHLIDAGDYITINGYTYKVLTDGGAAAYTLDRPFRGATATVVVANIHDQGATAPTEVGIEITDRYFNDIIAVSAGNIFSSSTITQTVVPLRTSGRGDDILELERIFKPHQGQLDNIPSYVPQPPSFAVSGTTYDLYDMLSGQPLSNSDMMGYGKNARTQLLTAFVSTVADTAGKNQSDFEDIMTVFYPDFVTLF